MISVLKIFCAKLKHNNYLQLTQCTNKKGIVKNAKLGWLGLNVECECQNDV
jgi:hypothetical protein